MKNYRHLTARDRSKISKLKSYGWSYAKIARKIGVDKSTISREIRRNGRVVDRDLKFWKKLYLDLGLLEDYERIKNEPNADRYLSYESAKADSWAKEQKKKSAKRTKIRSETKAWVIKQLKTGWTPDQIAGRSKHEAGQSISHESVYQLIIKDRKEGGRLYRLLTRFGKRKKRTSERTYKKQIIPGRVGIEHRPKIIAQRRRLGDLEGDFIVGKNHKSYLLTLVDRTSRQTAIERLKNRDRKAVEDAFIRAIKRFPEARTLTLDNAREFSCHSQISKITGVRVFFSNPYASYERGTIENTNGIIRRTYPKRTDFRKINDATILKLEERLNSTPRKVLGYLTSKEVAAKIRQPDNSVALRT